MGIRHQSVLLAAVTASILLSATTTQYVSAFSVPSSRAVGLTKSRSQSRNSPASTALRLVSPEQFDVDTVDQLIQQASVLLQDPSHSVTITTDSILSSTSQWLSDAAEAIASDNSGGWWQAYLRIFKGALTLVHSTIDGPLRSIGIEQTWGPSIAIFTFMARSLLIPLSIQQSRSAEYMKALRPYMTEIRQKFKDNQDAQNRAIGKLYEDAKQNPLAGCFTSLAQLPIFLGLYRGVRLLAMDGELQEPFLWIPSLEGPVAPPDYRGLDWLLKGWTSSLDGGLPEPSLGWETTLAFLIMPVVLVVLQSLTMRILQPPIDENASPEEKETLEKSQGILRFLPLMIGFFSLQVPAGLTIYWVTSNIFTLTQSLSVRAYFAANPPNITLPEYWDQALAKDADFDKMSPEERRRATEAGIRVGPTLPELMDEARFHCFIERSPLKDDSEAWQRVQSISRAPIAAELEDWVSAAKRSSQVNAASEAVRATS